MLQCFKDKPVAGDLIAGISVALVLVPQSIAYASLAGMPPVYGVYASILPPIVAAFFVSSPWLQTGPVALTCMLTLGSLTAFAAPYSKDYVALAALLALMVGLVRVVIGLLRSGYIAYLMSQPVLSGFTAAAALIIIASQLPDLFGLDRTGAGVVHSAFHTLSNPDQWSPASLGLGIFSMIAIISGRRFHPLFPGVLIAVAAGLAYSFFFGYDRATVGSLPSELPLPSFDLPWLHVRELLLPAIVIALVGFAEPAAIARSMATKNRKSWSVDGEFISQGMANLASGFSGAFPVGGSFSRSMINFSAGGQTRWSGAVTGLAVLAFLPFVSLLAPLPRTILAAIVISAVISLVDLRGLLNILRISPAQGTIGWATFSLTLALTPRVDIAIVVGIGLGVAVHLWREKRVEVLFDYQQQTLTLVPVGVLFFGSAPALGEILIQNLSEHPEAKTLVLDLRKVGRIDYTGVMTLRQVARDAEASGLLIRILPGGPLQGVKLLKRALGEDCAWLERHP